jgi:hypothetical protein
VVFHLIHKTKPKLCNNSSVGSFIISSTKDTFQLITDFLTKIVWREKT